VQDGLDSLFRRNFPVILGRCRRILGDAHEAADVAQETFLRLWQSGLGGAPPLVRARWIYRTSSRLAIDHLRRRRRGVEVPADPLADPAAGEPRADDVLSARQWLAAVAAHVPARELELAILSRVDGMSHPDIARATDLSLRTVERRLARFAARLQRLEARLR
jgi:RNA polymerase sigma-70 factor (ECF subfamily)